ncbi:hypothetical protein [Nocardia sp. NPDC050710]|uniref:hypothetical protein n=1 Tax=Nocardia sp. NPDC050710 TaxID=3157220 RepID=UPI0033C33160
METTEIQAALAQSRSLPHGRARTQRLETLAAAARAGQDRALEGGVLLELAKSYANAGERDLAPVAYGRLLQLYDEFPAELGPMTHSVHWYLKWMTWGLIENPAVPLPTIHRWLDELENRYRQRGYSARPVLGLRADLARELGADANAARLVAAALAAPRDSMSDCDACERDGWGTTAAAAGDDEAALDYWQPVLDGERSCAEEPHRVLSKALLPLVRSGRTAAARSAHLTGYPLVRHTEDLRDAVARHLEFCALTGNEARGLELLTEHLGWLTDPGADAALRLSFAVGVSVLLDRLSVLGLGALPLGTGTVGSVRADLGAEIEALVARYDARNGSTVMSARVAARLAQRPLLDQLPLGVRGSLPEPARIPSPAGPSARTETQPDPEAVDDRASEALRLADLAAAHLLDDPGQAEEHLRRALAIGARVLPAEHLARLSSQLVMVISGQPGRELALAEVALDAAARWDPISEADAVHLTFVAARAYHRAGRHGEAAALFEQPIEAGVLPYPDNEMAVLRGQYGKSLKLLGRHREAAVQFVEGARLADGAPGSTELQADLAWSAASALDACGADDQARVSYLRAAQLWGDLGRIGPRARCLRSAAWLQYWGESPNADAGIAALGELIAELEQLDESPEAANELAHTRRQLADMQERDD